MRGFLPLAALPDFCLGAVAARYVEVFAPPLLYFPSMLKVEDLKVYGFGVRRPGCFRLCGLGFRACLVCTSSIQRSETSDIEKPLQEAPEDALGEKAAGKQRMEDAPLCTQPPSHIFAHLRTSSHIFAHLRTSSHTFFPFTTVIDVKQKRHVTDLPPPQHRWVQSLGAPVPNSHGLHVLPTNGCFKLAIEEQYLNSILARRT